MASVVLLNLQMCKYAKEDAVKIATGWGHYMARLVGEVGISCIKAIWPCHSGPGFCSPGGPLLCVIVHCPVHNRGYKSPKKYSKKLLNVVNYKSLPLFSAHRSSKKKKEKKEN